MKPDVADEFQEVYLEIDELKSRVEKLESNLENCVSELYNRVRSLEVKGLGRVDWSDWRRLDEVPKAECEVETGDAPANGSAAIPQNEGHPIPAYDIAIQAEEEVDEEVDALYENLFMNAAMEYVYHYLKFKPDMPRGEKELRAWGHQNYLLHTALVEAYEAL